MQQFNFRHWRHNLEFTRRQACQILGLPSYRLLKLEDLGFLARQEPESYLPDDLVASLQLIEAEIIKVRELVAALPRPRAGRPRWGSIRGLKSQAMELARLHGHRFGNFSGMNNACQKCGLQGVELDPLKNAINPVHIAEGERRPGWVQCPRD